MSEPTDIQIDALREIANVGAGHAATALSRLVGGKKVRIDVPRVLMGDAATLPARVGVQPQARMLVATLGIQGELQGHVLMVLPVGDARRLSSLLIQGPLAHEWQDAHKDALTEAANIAVSACLSAIGDLTGLRLIPSVPALSECAGEAALDDALDELDEGAGVVVALEARFIADATLPVEGQMFVVPSRHSLGALLKRLGV